MKLNKTEIHILSKKIYETLEKENQKLEETFQEKAEEDAQKYLKEIKIAIPDFIFNEINSEYFKNEIKCAVEKKFYKRKYDFYQSDVSDDIILKLANNAYSGDIESLEQELLTKYQNDAK